MLARMDSSDNLRRHLLIGFVLALVVYAGFFAFDQKLRKRKGAWEVSFQSSPAGHPGLVINQPTLHITNVHIVFLAETLTNSEITSMKRIVFDRPQQPIPFGKTKFEDLTYLPGSVAFDLFGHEVELLPRTLYLNKKEYLWRSGAVYELNQNDKLPPEASYDPRKKKKSFFRRENR
jgi:hypothetical protein